MKILLKQMTLINFKGIRSLTIYFDEDVTTIYGTNRAGKTSITDAFNWVLFGKDSLDRKDFEIKTLDENNKPYHKLDHEVSIVLDVDGQIIVPRRTLREKWVTKRGERNEVFSGHETHFFWNDVPCKAEEYSAKINSLLNEGVFKLITNTTYFNSLKWQERRQVLLSIAGTITDAEVLDSLMNLTNVGEFDALINALNSNKTFDEYKREIANKKKRIKDEMILIPARLDEAKRSLPDAEDYPKIQTEIDKLDTESKEIDAKLNDKAEVLKAQGEARLKKQKELQDDRLAKQKQVQELKTKCQQMDYDAKNSTADAKRARIRVIDDLVREIKTARENLVRKNSDHITTLQRKETLVRQRQTLLDQFDAVSKEELKFTEDNFANEFSCPACKRAFDDFDLASRESQLEANFNEDKSKRKDEIRAKGVPIKKEIEAIDVKIGNLEAERSTIELDIKNWEDQLEELRKEDDRLTEDEQGQMLKYLDDHGYAELTTKITLLESEISQPQVLEQDEVNLDEEKTTLQTRKKEIWESISLLNKKLSTKDQRDRTLKRITELQDQEKTMSNEIAQLEGIEFSIEKFTKAKMDMLESRINGRFRLVKFKLFETQINGGEVETCITLLDGVPYSDANLEFKVNAGIDIINTLSQHYMVFAPVFIDNRESVVIGLEPCQSQIINLVASRLDKTLRVTNDIDIENPKLQAVTA